MWVSQSKPIHMYLTKTGDNIKKKKKTALEKMLLQYFPKVEPDPTTVYTRTFTPYPKQGSFFSA